MYIPKTLRALFLISPIFLASDGFAANQAADTVAPENTTDKKQQSLVTAQHEMVATANPIATKVGYDTLKAGGSAIDALVAVQMTLGLVEPQSSGLGGGGFVVYYDATKKQLTTFDGRETAPMKATPELFQDKNGKPLKFYDAVVGGRSVGTPGTVKLMAELHKRYGRTPWADLLKPAEKMALDGFIVSPRLANSVANSQEQLSRYPETKAYFFNLDNTPIKAGQRLHNLSYAKTLTDLGVYGPDIFYKGKLGQDIVRRVNSIADNPGVLIPRRNISL